MKIPKVQKEYLKFMYKNYIVKYRYMDNHNKVSILYAYSLGKGGMNYTFMPERTVFSLFSKGIIRRYPVSNFKNILKCFHNKDKGSYQVLEIFGLTPEGFKLAYIEKVKSERDGLLNHLNSLNIQIKSIKRKLGIREKILKSVKEEG